MTESTTHGGGPLEPFDNVCIHTGHIRHFLLDRMNTSHEHQNASWVKYMSGDSSFALETIRFSGHFLMSFQVGRDNRTAGDQLPHRLESTIEALFRQYDAYFA